MNTDQKPSAFRALVLITNTKLTEKAIHLFNKGNIPVQLQFHAQGTATSDIMDILGLGGIEKNVLVAILPKKFADEMLRKLYDELKLKDKNSGIVFTIPLSGINRLLLKMSEQVNHNNTETEMELKKSMSETKYTMIAATVNQGFSEKVMNAARTAGAKGGTVFHNRCIINEETMSFWGFDFQEEKETVLIISDIGNKINIMQAICQDCGVNTKAQGIVLSMPIDSIIGFGEEY